MRWLLLGTAALSLSHHGAAPQEINGSAANTSTRSGIDCPTWSTRFQQHLDGVCVCTRQQCHTTSHKDLELRADHANVFETSKRGKRFAHSRLKLQRVDASRQRPDLVVDLQTLHQQIIGFGGSFTDATAINLYKTKPELQQQILDAYYSENGLQYTIGRVPIASTDFSESVYSYNPVVDDLEMEHFSIDVDKAPNSHKLDLIHRALNTSSRELKLFASSWAPPVWMTRENHTENCTLKGEPGDKYWKALALYYSKFFDAYAQEGIKFWAMTTQNEPEFQRMQQLYWQSLKFNSTIEGLFIKKDLGPLLKQNHPELKIIMMDDMKDLIVKRQSMLEDEEVRKYVSGLGVHWYWNWDFLHKGDFDALAAFHRNHSDMFIIGTEACEGYLPSGMGTGVGVRIREPDIVWQRGENYARDIINDLANFASAWTDWNLVLNTSGGPNWVDNVVDAPIIVDETGGEEFYLQPMYFVLGHISKFLAPGSVRVDLVTGKEISEATNTSLQSVDRVAVMNPSNQTILVLSNRKNATVALDVLVKNQIQPQPTSTNVNVTNDSLAMRVELAPNSIQTIVLPSWQQQQGNNVQNGGDASSPTSSATSKATTSWWQSGCCWPIAMAVVVLLDHWQ